MQADCSGLALGYEDLNRYSTSGKYVSAFENSFALGALCDSNHRASESLSGQDEIRKGQPKQRRKMKMRG